MLNKNQIKWPDINEVFEHLIKRVLETQTFGVTCKPIELNYVTSSGKHKADRFNFSIPYAGHTLRWTVLFNSSCPEMGPDFEFHDDFFLVDPDVDTIETHIPSLANWHSMEPESLLNVLNELTLCYKQHQVDLLSRMEQRLHMEYTMLVDKADVCSKDVEIILLPDAEAPNEARFVIRLAMDFSRLPGRSNKAISDAAMMVISFQQPNLNRVTPQLYLTTTLEQTFANAGLMPLSIPALSRDKPVMNYIPEVKKIISDKVNKVVESYEKRNNFIATLLFLQRRNVVEYDATDFNRITILLEHQDFFFLVHFLLLPTFPSTQPIVSLQSIYHMNSKDELVKMLVQNYPYSPRWEPSRMIIKILEQIVSKNATQFKSSSMSPANHRG